MFQVKIKEVGKECYILNVKYPELFQVKVVDTPLPSDKINLTLKLVDGKIYDSYS